MVFVFAKKSRRVDKVLEDYRRATAHGGQLIVDALAKEFGLWERILSGDGTGR
jgi:hypothetical protein